MRGKQLLKLIFTVSDRTDFGTVKQSASDPMGSYKATASVSGLTDFYKG